MRNNEGQEIPLLRLQIIVATIRVTQQCNGHFYRWEELVLPGNKQRSYRQTRRQTKIFHRLFMASLHEGNAQAHQSK